MADDHLLASTSLAAARRRALLPPRILTGTAAVLSLLGIRGLIQGPAPATAPRPAAVATPFQPSTAGFAEAFARAYLTWDAARPEIHARTLAPFLGPDIDVDAGLPVPVRGRSRVTWTATTAQTRTDGDRVVVTVVIALVGDPKLRYLAVPVRMTAAGLAVSDYPALVGAPTPAHASGRTGDDIEDHALAVIVRRALTNYLAGQTDNLRADLLPGARLAPPAQALVLDDVSSLQWAGRDHRRLGAVIVARDPSGDVAYTLRYELRVARRDRWYVAEINPPMARKELP